MLTVEDWSNPKKGKLYKGIVRKVDKKARCLHVTIESLDPSQLGRIHDVSLPLPIRPGNRTCTFLMARGVGASTVGTKVCLDDITGTTIGMRFGTVAQDGSQQVDFERIDDPSNTRPDISVQDSGDQSCQC